MDFIRKSSEYWNFGFDSSDGNSNVYLRLEEGEPLMLKLFVVGEKEDYLIAMYEVMFNFINDGKSYVAIKHRYEAVKPAGFPEVSGYAEIGNNLKEQPELLPSLDYEFSCFRILTDDDNVLTNLLEVRDKILFKAIERAVRNKLPGTVNLKTHYPVFDKEQKGTNNVKSFAWLFEYSKPIIMTAAIIAAVIILKILD